MSRLYLIDDHQLVREGLRALLEGAGHEVLGESDDPTVALAELARLQPEVLLLDLHLGARTGFEVLAELQRRKLAVRVIVLSMSSQPLHVAEALRLGALGYVLKGSPGRQLLDAVEAVAQGRRSLGEQEAELAIKGLTAAPSQDALSPRERQILVMVAKGQSSAEIGAALHLSPKTVDTYRSRLMAKLELSDVPALVRWAIREGLISANDP